MTYGVKLRRLILPAILTLAAFIALVSLGNWQLRRLAWKEALIESATERPKLPVADVPPAAAWPHLDIAKAEYSPYRLTGRYLPDKQALVFTSLGDPRGKYGGPGYWVVTPFALEGGGVVLINRGFVPQDHAASDEPRSEATTLTGLLRPDDPHGLFTPADEPQKNLFFTRDIAAIAAAKHLDGPVAPFTIDLLAAETPPGGLPQAGETQFLFPNNHLQYALTWYGLAAALLAVFGGFAFTQLRNAPAAPRLTPPGRPS